jgi:hypothetical protein
LTNGQQDLEACRPCDLSDPNNPPGTDEDGNGLLYCWEYTNSVVRLDANPVPTIPGTNVPRDLGTILPHKPAQATEERIEVFNGCYLATTFLNGRPYSFTTCN